MSMLQLCALGVLAACLGYVLRSAGAKGAVAVSLAGGLAFLGYALARYREPIAALREMAERAGLTPALESILRMLFIGLLAGIAADICRDVGEAGLAARVEFCGRVEIILLALPFLLEIFTLALGVWQ